MLANRSFWSFQKENYTPVYFDCPTSTFLHIQFSALDTILSLPFSGPPLISGSLPHYPPGHPPLPPHP